MKKFEAECPTCGSGVEFTVSVSLVSVCKSCGSLVARSDRRIEDHGKVAALVETNSAFHLGQTGRFRDHPFEVVGRVQYKHPAGGVWEEWYVAFPGDKWAWIAEAQGKRFFTQQRKITSHMVIPSWEELEVGRKVPLGTDLLFQVKEFGTAEFAAAEGEIPFDSRPNAPHRFADLTGPKKGFASLVYEESKVILYLGKEVNLEELGISAVEKVVDVEPPVMRGLGLGCPQCGGSLELRAPDQAQRVTCPYCASLLDIEGGNLKYLKTLNPHIKPLIELGKQGNLFGVEYIVIGFVRRAVFFDAEYAWDEYLLYDRATGFRWLVHSDQHWSFVEPIDDLDVSETKLRFEGSTYRLFQRAWARVLHVYGEFYWKVAIGDTVMAIDYISPPRMITVEMTPTQPIPEGLVGSEGSTFYKFSETVISKGTYLRHADVEAAFSLDSLPRSAAVAPNQPGPTYWPIYLSWPLWIAALIVVDVLYSTTKTSVEHGWTVIAILLLSLYPIAMMMHQHAFEVSRWRDSEFNPYESNS